MFFKEIESRPIEKKIQHRKTIKRNRKIFDVDLINAIQSQEQMRRRTPSTVLTQPADDMLRTTFMNSTNAFQCKLKSNIQRFKKRLSSSLMKTEGSGNFQDNKNIKKSIKIKDRSKSLTLNQSRYNNFQPFLKTPHKFRKFDQYPGRAQNQKDVIEENETINYDKINKAYFNNNHNNGLNKCLFDYGLQKFEKPAIYMKSGEKEKKPLSQVRVDEAREHVISDWRKVQQQFKYASSKEVESNFEKRYGNSLTNWKMFLPQKVKGEKKPAIKPMPDMRTVDFERDQICDIKYFRILKCRQDRLNK